MRISPSSTAILGLLVLIGPSAWASDRGAVLNLADGGFVAGTLVDSASPKTLRWQGSAFASPFEFDINAVASVAFSALAEPPRPGGDSRFELTSGDRLFGTLVDLNGDEAIIDVPPFGRLHVRRSSLGLIERRSDRGGGPIYFGPRGLTGWRDPSGAEPPKGWRDDAGSPTTDVPGAAIRADLGLPARSIIEFELSWKTRPDFVLALAATDTESTAHRAFRFEVWDGQVVALRETDREADLAPLGKVNAASTSSTGSGPGPGRVQFRAYLDQDAGTLTVVSFKTDARAQIKAAGFTPGVVPAILLENHGGDIRLDRLRVDPWDGQVPADPQSSPPAARLVDGSTSPGRLLRFEPDSKTFILQADDGSETRLAADRLASLAVSPRGVEPPRSVRIALQNGSWLGGTIEKVEDGQLHLTTPGITETLRIPVADIRSLALTSPTTASTEKTPLTGRLELEGVRLDGHLVPSRDRPGALCLAWEPRKSTLAASLRPEVSGRIVYKETPQPAALSPASTLGQPMPVAPAVQNRNRGVILNARGMVFGSPVNPTAPAGPPRPKRLYLRGGDTIPAEVTKIDETGLSFRSPISENRFVAHDRIKAVELSTENLSPSRLSASERDRLLTLPRIQKESPPTHLVRSLNGDYLRGRLLSVDDKTLRVEVRLTTKDVPRDRVARIIWLHPDAPDPPPKTPPPADGPIRVQAVRHDGVRLTFAADLVEGTTLSGKSDVLGVCRVGLDAVDQILIGPAIQREAALLAFQQWKLHPAPDPKPPAEDDDGGGHDPTGQSSALIGKPAPDFELTLLDGKPFRLSENKGRVVVLDFWATWCGPCLQAMPRVDAVTREFRDQNVRLVAVNLQEVPEVISAMLARHKFDLTVALDRDGVVAEKYAAHAIPQTVVIGPDGTVARLFVGASPHLGDQLRAALKTLVAARKDDSGQK